MMRLVSLVRRKIMEVLLGGIRGSGGFALVTFYSIILIITVVVGGYFGDSQIIENLIPSLGKGPIEPSGSLGYTRVA